LKLKADGLPWDFFLQISTEQSDIIECACSCIWTLAVMRQPSNYQPTGPRMLMFYQEFIDLCVVERLVLVIQLFIEPIKGK
jgi:hypothetical protein